MIIVDTSALIDALTGQRRSAGRLRELVSSGERMVLPTIVLYEWWRGPRTSIELEAQEVLFPTEEAVPFGVAEAEVAASLYRSVRRARGREVDLAIAACAVLKDAALWTLNRTDFDDIVDLRLIPD